MGKKAKANAASNKKQVVEDTPKTSKIAKNSKKKDKQAQQQDINLFSESFHNRVNSFTQLYKDIEQGGSVGAFNLQEKFKEVGELLQNSCSKVLSSHLVEAEKWITGKINEFKDSIASLEAHENSVRRILEQSAVLDPSQIIGSTAGLRGKIQRQIASLKEYQDLLAKAKEVYG